SSVRFSDSGSSCLNQSTVCGGTGLSDIDQSGNAFCATAAAASARAAEGFMAATNACAPAKSFCAAPFNTPPTACARLVPERFNAHHSSALGASSFAQASTNAEPSRLRVRVSVDASQ